MYHITCIVYICNMYLLSPGHPSHLSPPFPIPPPLCPPTISLAPSRPHAHTHICAAAGRGRVANVPSLSGVSED